jgi:CheY-like chemotaxis protein
METLAAGRLEPFENRLERTVMQRRDCAEKIRVLIVDDHPIVRQDIHFLIDQQPDTVVCGVSEDASDALAKIAKLRPNIVSVGLNLASENGLELITQMRALGPAYVTKRAAAQTLVAGIRELMLPTTSGRCQQNTASLQVTNPIKTSKGNHMLKVISLLRAVAAVTVTCGVSLAQAATLTAVPMQGGMAMPMIAYHAEDGHLHVMMPSEVPQLTPLLVSNPGDNFAPDDPWYDFLDPSRQGLSFSRRYGFVMDSMSDPLPANTAIWIRKISGPPEMGFYRYSGSAPKTWEPIFGTTGTSNALYWNGMMFHPGVAAPPGTNSLIATFEAYVVNSITGQEVPGSGSGPLVFNWTNVPDGRPTLDIAMKVVVAWPAATSGYVLEWADTASSSVWTTVTNTPVTLDDQPAVVLHPSAAAKFFRMRKVP